MPAPRRVLRPAITGLLLVVASATAACSGGSASPTNSAGGKPRPRSIHPSRTEIAGVPFVAAGAHVRHECQQTANAVGYAVPCPTMLPEGITATPPVPGCRFAIVGWDRGCAGPKNQIFGSSQLSGQNAGPAGFQHLVVQGAPRVVRDPARAIGARARYLRARGIVRVGGSTMRWYYVSPGSNDLSAFAHHLVLVWSASGHTYAYGFHVVTTLADARKLDLELVRHLVVVYPRASH
jgi:hypothetical protein